MSSDPAELKKLVKQLQSSSNNTKDILGILSILKRDFQINEAILRESKAGLAVGKLRNSGTKEVADAAKDLVKKWKAEVEQAKASSGTTSKPQASKSSTNGPATPVTPTASTAKTEIRTAKSDGAKINFTGDKTRDKCAELIYDALVSDSGAPSELVSNKARDVELAVFNSHGGASTEYRARIRSLFVNLKDKNNPGLRESVVSGLIAADKLAKMSSAEMASEERQAADQKIKQENFFASLGAEEQQAETDAFQCGRCKQRKCRYRQAQTRSADEPMTTFYRCTACAHQWREN